MISFQDMIGFYLSFNLYVQEKCGLKDHKLNTVRAQDLPSPENNALSKINRTTSKECRQTSKKCRQFKKQKLYVDHG